MNYGIDDVLKADKLMTAKLLRPPYYDPLPALLRRAGQALNVLVRFGRNGVYVIQRPSDATMKRLEHESANRTAL